MADKNILSSCFFIGLGTGIAYKRSLCPSLWPCDPAVYRRKALDGTDMLKSKAAAGRDYIERQGAELRDRANELVGRSAEASFEQRYEPGRRPVQKLARGLRKLRAQFSTRRSRSIFSVDGRHSRMKTLAIILDSFGSALSANRRVLLETNSRIIRPLWTSARSCGGPSKRQNGIGPHEIVTFTPSVMRTAGWTQTGR